MMHIITSAIEVSYWAKRHTQLARLLIVLCFVLLTVLAIVMGQLLYMQELRVPVNVFWIALFVYVFSLSFYPAKKIPIREEGGVKHYLNRKLCDLLLAASTFVMILQQGNHFSWNVDRPLIPETIQRVQAARPVKVDPLQHSWKKQKRAWRDQVRFFLQQAKQITKGEKVALTLLAIALAIALLFGIGLLACNLSCSGAEGAAGAVVFFGVIGVVLLFILFLKFLNKKTTA